MSEHLPFWPAIILWYSDSNGFLKHALQRLLCGTER